MAELQAARYHSKNFWRAARRWFVPYVQSRILAHQFRPLLSYLFTEFKCNVDCHYCWAYNNKVKGMTEETAIRSINWLKSNGCRVIAIMGGEPLLRRDFIIKVVDYGTKNGFFMYLPTNGILMNEDFIDRIGDVGVAAINLAVDCIQEKPGLPKNLKRIEKQFQYLVKQQRQYGYMIVFNTNICRNNMADVRLLTEIAHDNGISTDVHINEPPYLEQAHFKHLNDNVTYILREDWAKADELLDWLIEKNAQGYIMVNSKDHLRKMKDFMRGITYPWNCRAGHNSSLIRPDGSLAPCFPMYSSNHDWGNVFDGHRFDRQQLDDMKKVCNSHCLSTCQYVLGYYYNNAHVLRWILKQGLHGWNLQPTTDLDEPAKPRAAQAA